MKGEQERRRRRAILSDRHMGGPPRGSAFLVVSVGYGCVFLDILGRGSDQMSAFGRNARIVGGCASVAAWAQL